MRILPACQSPVPPYGIGMRFALERTLAVPLPDVYAYLAEPKNRPEWQSTLRSVEMLTEGETGIGTRWRENAIGFGTSEMEIVVFEPNRAWGERAKSPFGDAEVVLRFEPAGDGQEATRVRLEAALEVSRLVAPAARLVLSTIFRHDLARAEKIVRSRRKGTDSPPA